MHGRKDANGLIDPLNFADFTSITQCVCNNWSEIHIVIIIEVRYACLRWTPKMRRVGEKFPFLLGTRINLLYLRGKLR